MISRRTFTAGVGASLLPLSASRAQEATWPSKTVRVIVPYVAGGILDVLTRHITNELATKLGQPFVIENRVGASGNIGTGAAARAAPDGYTVVSTSSSAVTTNQFLYNNLTYDPERDFAISSIFWENTNCLFVSGNHPARTVAEFVEWAKKRPQGVTYGSAGVGTSPHLAAELFKLKTGIDARHVPYPGAPQTALAIMAGDIDFAVDNIGPYPSFLQSGQIRGLAVTADERWPRLPDVPTMPEAGLKDVVITTWGCFAFPAATPPAIVSKLSNAIASITSDPAMQARFLDTSARAISMTPEKSAALAQAERKKWSEVIKAAGIKPG